MAIEAITADEARRLADAATTAGLPLWLLGGGALKVTLGETLHPRFDRDIQDVDFVTRRSARKDVIDFFEAMGYVPDGEFNALHGAQRLLFHDPEHGRQVDIFVDSFRMCHDIPLTERLVEGEPTVPLAELLLTKLQIVKLNEKDRNDLYALLLGCELTDDDSGINVERIAELCAAEWGLFRTVEINLDRLRAGLVDLDIAVSEKEVIEQALRRLTQAMEEKPKKLSWRMRAKVGDRVTWYEDPDEVSE